MWIRIKCNSLKSLIYFIFLIIVFIFSNLAYSSQVFKFNGDNYYLSHLYIPDNSKLEIGQIIEIIDQNHNTFDQITGIYIIKNKESISVQEELLKNGKAIFYPDLSIDKYWYDRLFKQEQIAIRNKVGIWQNNEWLSTENLLNTYTHKFIIINGIIDKISLYRNSFYINLDKNRFKKLVIMFPKSFLRTHGIKIKNHKHLIGRKIIARGWLNFEQDKIYLIPSNHLMIHFEE